MQMKALNLVSKKCINVSIISFFVFSLIVACKNPETKTPIYKPDGEVAHKWADMSLKMMWRYSSNTPVYCSRALALLGLTMYETVVKGDPSHRTLVGQVSGLNFLPSAPRGININWKLALNSGQAYMLKNLYPSGTSIKKRLVDSLETAIYNSEIINSTDTEISASVEYGQSIAMAIWEWSKNDGGYKGYERNFDPSYEYPSGKGYWVHPTFGQVSSIYPLQPYWGTNRTFAPKNAQLPIPSMIKYSELENSEYYLFLKEVHDKSFSLSKEDREIAAWWADDPSETFSPPGHSYSIASIIVKKEKVDLFKASETFARVGLAVADAFINCWKAKYTYHCERPSKFIRANIDSTWIQFWPEPPFPSFYSGHSVQGAAAAEVLIDLYGNNFAFEDNTHIIRVKDFPRDILFLTRKYTSFEAMANESAYSRLLGGIHTRYDNEVGLSEGKKIGNNINQLKWKF